MKSGVGDKEVQEAVPVSYTHLDVYKRQPYHDSTVDYEALAVKRNAPRWIKQLRKFGYLPKMA